jgi:hypothetical protein
VEGVYLEAEHPVDEALGCMVPISVAATVVVVLMVLLLGG